MSTGGGIVAALSAPFLLDVGFLIWDKHWKGSSFALNLYKCTLASIGFLILSFATRPPGATDPADNDAAIDDGRGPAFPPELFTVQSVGFLMLSSTIGILIGDWTCLEALQLIGARPVVLMDSIKPFLAALLGWAILGERLQWPAFVGMALTVGGVVWVSLEREGGDGSDDDDDDDDKGDCKNDDKSEDRFEDNDDAKEGQQNTDEAKVTEVATETKRKRVVTAKDRRKGYALSVANVVLDTYGSLLTKQYGKGMSTWNISLIRFGFASAFCITLSSILNLRDALKYFGSKETKDNVKVSKNRARNGNASSLRGSIVELFNYRLGKDMAAHTPNIEELHKNKSMRKEQDIDEVTSRSTDNVRPWYSLPKMGRKSYAIISLGVAFTTFATPALSNYALFQIALALALTLGSMGPVYMLPLSWLIQGDRPTFRACLGAVLAVAGVAILSFGLWLNML